MRRARYRCRCRCTRSTDAINTGTTTARVQGADFFDIWPGTIARPTPPSPAGLHGYRKKIMNLPPCPAPHPADTYVRNRTETVGGRALALGGRWVVGLGKHMHFFQ